LVGPSPFMGLNRFVLDCFVGKDYLQVSSADITSTRT